MRQRYTASDFEPHIPNSGGIVSTISDRVGCAWKTAKTHIERTPKLKELFESECETSLDLAESVIVNNIRAARRLQEEAEAAGGCVIVDSSDARWFLTRKGRGRGYGESADVNLMTPPGRIAIKTIRVHLPADMEDGG